MGGVGEKPRATMDMMGGVPGWGVAWRGVAGGPRRRGAVQVIPPVDFSRNRGPWPRVAGRRQDGRLDEAGRKEGLVGRSRSARRGGRPRFRGETAWRTQ